MEPEDDAPTATPRANLGAEPGDPAEREALQEAGRRLFAAPCGFLLSVAQMAQLPASDLPEIAFAGRSNVGKSSLVNALTGRKTLARTSNTPGRTQQLNFFDLGGRLMLVDLPGYGYAQAAKSDITQWTRLTRDYLRGRAQLRRVLLLIDARHGLKPNDRQVMAELDTTAVVYEVVLTKADKVKPAELEALLARCREELASHVAAHPEIAVTSAVKQSGIAELRAGLGELALREPLS
ncbi:ribosome biogenesis GTP-binding protein YihA/YsxC [Algihabitans albus]|uniref:ribosome biogenesis GTP-binding protein YihA/YsxC n=1 Tax=Algihabitans albus TaxID=2164067 RepID=UPI0038B29208